MSRRAYEMTEADLAAIMAACRPVPAIMLHIGNPPSAQSNANAAWCELGRRMGFDGMTAEPAVDGGGPRCFTAEEVAPPPTEPKPVPIVAELVATVDWLRQTYHRAHHDGDLDTCPKNTCQAARAVIAKATGATP